MGRTAWHVRAGAVVVGWLLALAVVTIAHRGVPESRWLMVHLLLLGAASNAILVWSNHFAAALLRLPEPPTRRAEGARLLLFNIGAVAVVAGMLGAYWALVLVGGVLASLVVLWHVVALLLRMRAALPSRFAGTLRYYVCAGLLLPVGIGLGITMAHGSLSDAAYGRIVVAHALLNLLGWISLTVLGTLVTLWPTMLRTRMADRAEVVAGQALPVLVGSLVVAVAGALTGLRLVAAVGILGYLAALLWWGRPVLHVVRAKAPGGFATWSVLGGLAWLLGSVVTFAVMLLATPDWSDLVDRAQWLTAPLLAGFVLPVLLGAMSYLVPVVLGGGPTVVRATTAVLDRGALTRVVTANLALLVCVLPVPSLVRVVCSVVLLAVYVVFVPLVIRARLVAHRAEVAAAAAEGPPARPAPYRPPEDPVAPQRKRASVGIGLAVVLLAVAAGVAADPPAIGGPVASAAGDVMPTGHTTTVQVTMQGMRFHPGTVQVPAGDRLVLELTNADDQTHDLVLETGAQTPRLDPGQHATLDVGVVGRDLSGWCSIAGHRQMGMVFAVEVTGATGGTVAAGDGDTGDMTDMPGMDHGATSPSASATAGPSAAEGMDLMADPAPGFAPYDAQLPPLPSGRVHHVTLEATDVVVPVAPPDVTQTRWTFGGTAPGPTLHGKVGDVFVVTLVNHASMGHSIDFHAGSLAPDQPMRTIEPGESLTYRFTATHSGIWMYHCSTMPMSLHIANGMYGAVVIDPPDLAKVDREYVLVQSELYLGPQGGIPELSQVASEHPDLVVFNGYANQYDHAQLTARVGERVRIWVLDAGPNVSGAFHVVGGQFDTVYKEGAYLLRPGPGVTGGSQVLDLSPAQGGFVELTFPEAGHYPFVSHIMSDSERGAHGIIHVS